MTDEQLAKIEGQANELMLWSDSDTQEDAWGYALAFQAFCGVANEEAVLEMIALIRRYKAALEEIEANSTFECVAGYVARKALEGGG
jgi:hypothetical protein